MLKLFVSCYSILHNPSHLFVSPVLPFQSDDKQLRSSEMIAM